MVNGQKLRVGLVFDDSLDKDDGVAQYVKRLGGWLSGQGHTVVYLVGETRLQSWDGGNVYSLAKNQSVRFNGNKLSVPLPANGRKIKQILRENPLDILHVMVPYSPLMAQKIIKLVPDTTAVVGTFHIFPAGKTAKAGGRLLRFAYGKNIARFNSFMAVSRPAGDYARNSFGIKTDCIIPNPVDIKSFSSNKTSGKDYKIIFLGRLVKRKGCAQLIDAFSLLSAKDPGIKLVIAGDGPERQILEKKAAKYGLSRRIEFIGYIDEDQKADLLNSASIACFPSLYGESFGIVLIEAMAAGSGVVLGGNNPGYESVLGAQPKLLVDPNNAEEFAERLSELLVDKKLAAKLHKWQKDTVGQYDVDVVGRQVTEVYYQAIARLSKKRHNRNHGIQTDNG